MSLLDPGFDFPELGPEYAGRHLRLAFHDIERADPPLVVPAAAHVDRLLGFLAGWREGESLLVHCRAGISRSTATAYVAACWRNPEVPERAIAEALRAAAPLARPNGRLVALADARMGRGGRMSAAIEVTGRALPWLDVDEGNPFSIPARFPGRG